jgi:hypothetical protein
MTDFETALKIAQNKMQIGEITVDQANVLAVQIAGVRLITAGIPASVRKALNAAVKEGELGHIKKEGLRPEAYHHINGRARALDERDRVFRSTLAAVSKICTNG